MLTLNNINKNVFVIGNLHLLYNAITMFVYLMKNIHQLNYSIAIVYDGKLTLFLQLFIKH